MDQLTIANNIKHQLAQQNFNTALISFAHYQLRPPENSSAVADFQKDIEQHIMLIKKSKAYRDLMLKAQNFLAEMGEGL